MSRTNIGNFYRAVSSWLSFVFQFKFQAMLAATFLALVAAAVLLFGGRRAVRARCSKPDPASRGSVLSQPPVGGVLVDLAADAGGRRVPGFDGVLLQLLQCAARRHRRLSSMRCAAVIGVVFCVNRLANAALAPRLPNWRLIPVETRPGALAGAADDRHGGGHRRQQFPDGRQRQDGLAAVADHRPELRRDHHRRRHPDPDGAAEAVQGDRRKLAAVAGLAALYCASRLACSPSLRRCSAISGWRLFVSLQVVVTGTILITAYIGFLSARAIGEEGGFAEHVGRALAVGAIRATRRPRSTSSAWWSASPST